MKRAVDVLGAGRRARAGESVVGIAALAIKLDDGGPVFYRQRRVGHHGEEFDLLKLRTMIPRRREAGAGWAVDFADPRITAPASPAPPLGGRAPAALERAPRGDEPRRPAPHARLPGRAVHAAPARRLDVKPGLTGWAQVNGRARLLWTDRIELDLWYVEHRSAWLDLKIIARTLRVLF